MRIWSVHPQHLDAKGLVALWRETLLAQKVLLGQTKGYRNHPQLKRFKSHADPIAAIGAYLRAVQLEAARRGYNFDASKILHKGPAVKISVTDGQVAYELRHLKAKLKARDFAAYERLTNIASPSLHPLFTLIDGGIEDWEVL
ncbi:pyrimidine dimer DNA glycosylase/endonuclease V [Sideroxydans sp. CL21]|uniref:pyrimidine dimer DNA glycosylase/endonuclease V n=1 Tax=Sideroxydans sp. CL21 TaxID=2600596 RepID=UPI0024BC146F|nr:pyrimidine dimer DNA glycosylase/endonuclease V [Sideroxydans sp. CL21]